MISQFSYCPISFVKLLFQVPPIPPDYHHHTSKVSSKPCRLPQLPIRIGTAPLPAAGPNERVIKNAAVAVNPLDCHMYAIDLAILAKLGGGHLAYSQPPPANISENVTAGMIFAINNIATPAWEDFVTRALKSGKLLCLPPPTVVGKGLEFIEEALEKRKAVFSATKLVVEM